MQPATDYTGVDMLEIMAGAHHYNRYLTSLVDAEITEGCVALDFGAGTGTFALPLQERGVRVLCVESDPYLKTRLQQHGLTVFATLSELPDESVDLIYTFNVFEHIKDDEAVIKELGKKLKKGGRMVVYVPAFPLLYSGFDSKVGHYRRYRRTGLSAAVSSAGLHVVRVYYADSLGFFAALAYKIIGNKSGDVNPRLVAFFDKYLFPSSRVLDIFFHRFVGKNLYLVAQRPQ